jgi:rSAM/selenodomain-associated transferase 1
MLDLTSSGREPAEGFPIASSAGLGIMCKAPRPGRSKTRLSQVIGPDHAAALSGCFLKDVASVVAAVAQTHSGKGYGIYAPAGSEAEVRAYLPPTFGLVLQDARNFGMALRNGARHLLQVSGHGCAILINSDSPSLPPGLLAAAVEALRRDGDRVVLGPATDGGYTLIGIKRDHPALFEDIPWSTPEVLGLTVERAKSIDVDVETLPTWYDVDDADTFSLLLDEIAGLRPSFGVDGMTAGPATATRAYLAATGLSR